MVAAKGELVGLIADFAQTWPRKNHGRSVVPASVRDPCFVRECLSSVSMSPSSRQLRGCVGDGGGEVRYHKAWKNKGGKVFVLGRRGKRALTSHLSPGLPPHSSVEVDGSSQPCPLAKAYSSGTGAPSISAARHYFS